MRIIILHNKYRLAGGEDVVADAEAQLLQRAGHDVRLVQVSNEDIKDWRTKSSAFIRSSYNSSRRTWVAGLVREFRADVVHVHNFFPLLSPAVHDGAALAGAAVVQTLHNFRIFCAGSQFLRNSNICEKCLVGSKAWGVLHRCYQNSVVGSIAVARMQHRIASTNYIPSVHRFIALTEFAREKYVTGGVARDRVSVKPNFVPDTYARSTLPRSGALFVGRLSKEKGLAALLEAWRKIPDIMLTIVGDGPDRGILEAMAPQNVVFCGHRPPEDVAHYMRTAAALIVPSIWYEGFPVTIVEAFAAGLPVLASRIGSLAEIIEVGNTGLLFEPGDAASIVKTILRGWSEKELLMRMGGNARVRYEQRYSPLVNLRQLEDIYDEALQVSRCSEAVASSL